MNKKYELGNFICALREECEMDQKTLAQLLGVSSSAISQCENGGGIKIEKLFQLSELFGVTLDELLEAKRSNQTLEGKWESIYDINDYDMSELIESGDVDTIKGFYNRVAIINDSFYKLIDKWIFCKTTDEEYKELCYLWQYFETTNYLNRYREKYVICFNDEQRRNEIKEVLSQELKGCDKQTVLWELPKIFVLKVKLYVDEVIELIINDGRIEREDANIDCGKALFKALPKISQDLLYSRIVYNSDNSLVVNAFQRIMGELGAELLYLPKSKNFITIDEEDFENIESEVELDEALTSAVKIYRNKFINDFEYKSWAELDYTEYQQCIDKNKTVELKLLMELQSRDLSVYWEKYKSMKHHIKYLKEEKL